jgi:hypothetical protein
VIACPFIARAVDPTAASNAALAPSSRPPVSAQATGTSIRWKAATGDTSGAEAGDAASMRSKVMQVVVG